MCSDSTGSLSFPVSVSGRRPAAAPRSFMAFMMDRHLELRCYGYRYMLLNVAAANLTREPPQSSVSSEAASSRPVNVTEKHISNLCLSVVFIM